MAQNANARWLVGYDISDKRNWAKVFKRLKKEGVPIQYSLFKLNASAAKIAALAVELATMIDPKTDDIRIYRIPENAWTVNIGAAMVPEDVWIDPH